MCVDGDVIKWEVGERKVGFPSKRGDEWRVSGSLSGLKVISVTIKIYKQIPKCHYSVAATVAVISNDPVRKKMPKFTTEGYSPHREAIFIVKKLLSVHPQGIRSA